MPATTTLTRISPSGSWRPDRRARLTVAVLATLLAVLGFVQLLGRQTTATLFSVPLTLSVQRSAVPQRNQVKPPRVVLPSGRLQPVIPVTVPPASLSALPPDWQMAAEAAVEAEGGGPVHTSTRAASGSLQRALQAPPPLETLQDGQAYHNAYGSTIMKSAGGCGEMRTVSTGPAPQDKTVVTAPIACPGDHQPSMGEELLGWAKKMQRKLPPPPR